MVVNPKKNSFGDEITVWTEFQLPKSEKFRGKKWSDFFLLIRTTHGQGYSWWGPVLERQDPYNNTMLLVQGMCPSQTRIPKARKIAQKIL